MSNIEESMPARTGQPGGLVQVQAQAQVLAQAFARLSAVELTAVRMMIWLFFWRRLAATVGSSSRQYVQAREVRDSLDSHGAGCDNEDSTVQSASSQLKIQQFKLQQQRSKEGSV